MRHSYKVQGQRGSGSEWETIFETSDAVEAVFGAHEQPEGWFWYRVLEDGQVCVGPF